MNDGIEVDVCTLSYVKVDDAVRAVREKGRGARLAKLDVRSAYQIVPVDRWLLGMVWDEALYVDTVPRPRSSTPWQTQQNGLLGSKGCAPCSTIWTTF